MSEGRKQIEFPSGSRTTVEQWGEAGPAIVFVHGIGSSRCDARRLGEALAADCRVFAYDQRGHGDSAADPGSMGLSDLAMDLRWITQSIGGVALAIGHSWGGAVVLEGGADVAAELLLIDPVIRVLPGTFHEYLDDLHDVLGIEPGENRIAAIRVLYREAHPLDREAKVHAMERLRLDDIARLGRENRVEQGGWDLRTRVQSLTIPTTILLPDQESVIAADDLDHCPPCVRIEPILGHGHALHRSAFQQYVEFVRERVL